MTEPRALANEIQRKLWDAIADLPLRLYLIVGPGEAQAHLLGNLVLERSDGEDVIVLGGTETHVHVNWAAVTCVTLSKFDGYDCISFRDQERVLLELLPESIDYLYPADIVSCVRELENST